MDPNYEFLSLPSAATAGPWRLDFSSDSQELRPLPAIPEARPAADRAESGTRLRLRRLESRSLLALPGSRAALGPRDSELGLGGPPAPAGVGLEPRAPPGPSRAPILRIHTRRPTYGLLKFRRTLYEVSKRESVGLLPFSSVCVPGMGPGASLHVWSPSLLVCPRPSEMEEPGVPGLAAA